LDQIRGKRPRFLRQWTIRRQLASCQAYARSGHGRVQRRRPAHGPENMLDLDVLAQGLSSSQQWNGGTPVLPPSFSRSSAHESQRPRRASSPCSCTRAAAISSCMSCPGVRSWRIRWTLATEKGSRREGSPKPRDGWMDGMAFLTGLCASDGRGPDWLMG
jgi:hypothetical protein